MLPVQPGDLTDPARREFFSERAILRIVENGSPGTPMFGWKEVLTESSMRAVVAHLLTLTRPKLVTPQRDGPRGETLEPKDINR